MKPTRRDALVTIATFAAPAQAEAPPAFLSAVELESLKVLVDAIIPRTETAGASDAGVPAAIDRRLAASPPLAASFHSGLKALETDAQSRFGTSFSALTSPQQVEFLQPRVKDPFFVIVKDMTVEAYYTSREGLAGELGWHGNTFLHEFTGCTHPEHQR